MKSNWQKVKLKDIVTLHYGKGLTSDTRKEGEVPVYGSSGVTGYHSAALVNARGYIIGRKGNVGSVFYSDVPFYPIDTVYYVRDQDVKIDFRFFYYLLKTINFDQFNGDSVIPGLNREAAYAHELFIPSDSATQKSIASVLSSLDDTIELLRAQNKTLEDIAQTLFKRWFVDFEFPNENGKPYKSSGRKFVESEVREIPEGWRIGNLDDEFVITMGQSPDGTSYNENKEGIVFYQGRAEFGERFPSNRLYTTEPKRIAEKFDVLLSVRAPVGDINVANENCCIGRGLAAINSEFKSYCLYKIKSLKDVFNQFESEGTVFGSINKASLEEILSVIPTKEVMHEFNHTIKESDLKIYNNFLQIQTLSKLRDALLPKLMNGEINV